MRIEFARCSLTLVFKDYGGDRWYLDNLGQLDEWSPFTKLTTTDPVAAWLVVTEDATSDRIHVVRSVLGALSSLPIARRRSKRCVTCSTLSLVTNPGACCLHVGL